MMPLQVGDLHRGVDKGLHNKHVLITLLCSAPDPLLRRLAPHVGIELPNPAESFLFFLPIDIACTCALRRVTESFQFDRLRLALVERLDCRFVGGVDGNGEVGPEGNSTLNLNDLPMRITIYV